MHVRVTAVIRDGGNAQDFLQVAAQKTIFSLTVANNSGQAAMDGAWYDKLTQFISPLFLLQPGANVGAA